MDRQIDEQNYEWIADRQIDRPIIDIVFTKKMKSCTLTYSTPFGRPRSKLSSQLEQGLKFLYFCSITVGFQPINSIILYCYINTIIVLGITISMPKLFIEMRGRVQVLALPHIFLSLSFSLSLTLRSPQKSGCEVGQGF